MRDRLRAALAPGQEDTFFPNGSHLERNHISFTLQRTPKADTPHQVPGQTPKGQVVPRATGTGGIFFLPDNPQETKMWYGKHLGLAIGDDGAAFKSRDLEPPDKINPLQWSPFDKNTDYFHPSEKGFMSNYRVQGIEKLVDNLRESRITILDDIQTYDYGKFMHIMDPEGRKIELWEPVDNTSGQETETH